MYRYIIEGVARTEPVRGVLKPVVVTPNMIRMFLRLSSVIGKKGIPWSRLRVQRAVAMAVTGFVAFLRHSEIDALDRCDISR